MERVRTSVRATSELVGEFQRIFKTDVTQALDKVNNLFGVDMHATFSPERRQAIARSIPAAGLAAGFTSDQIVGLGAASQNVAMQAGYADFTGGLSSGIMAAQIFRAAANEDIAGDSPFAFVNSTRFRNTLVRRTTGARLSGLSRDISGAAAILQREGMDYEGFLARVNSQEGQLSSERVAEIAGEFGYTGGATAGDLRDASFSQEARRFQEAGVGDMATLKNNAAFMSDVRRQTMDHVLRQQGIDPSKLNIEGPLTSRAVRAALEDIGQGGVADDLDRIFTQNARAFGFGNLEEADLFMNTIQRNKQLKELQVRTENISDLQGYISGVTDSVSGFEAFSDLVLSGDVEDATLGKIFQTFSGAKTADISAMFGDRGKGTFFDTSKIEGKRAQDLRKLAIGTATSVLFGGKFGNRAATADERKNVNKMFDPETSEEDREALFKAFEEKVADDTGTRGLMFELDFQERQRALQKKTEGDISKEQTKNLREAAFLEQFEKIDDIKLIEGTRTGSDEKKFRALLEGAKNAYQTAAEEGGEVSLTDPQQKAVEKARREATLNDDIAGVKKGGTESIVAVLTEILNAVKNADPNANKKGE
jgi:hypothetical protein